MSQARTTLNGLGLMVQLVSDGSCVVASQIGKVQSQSPAAGMPFPATNLVTLSTCR